MFIWFSGKGNMIEGHGLLPLAQYFRDTLAGVLIQKLPRWAFLLLAYTGTILITPS